MLYISDTFVDLVFWATGTSGIRELECCALAAQYC